MKRPLGWRRWLLLSCAVLMVIEYGTLTVIAPKYILSSLQNLVGGDLKVARARLALPLATVLTDVSYAPNTAYSTLRAEQVVIQPRWLPSARGEVQIESVRITRPFLRISRTAQGTLLWPHPPLGELDLPSLGQKQGISFMGWHVQGALRVRIESIRVTDGTLEWIDESTPTPVHLVLEHVSFELGPITVPATGESASTAMRAAVVGPTGDPSPLYCSGWWVMASRNMDVSCQLDPIPLSIFEPYFQRRPVIRFYSSTLRTATRWNALGNALAGRIQFELGNLTQGDISVRGRTILNARQLAGDDPDPKLTGEISFDGPLDSRRDWQGRFTPTNVPAQRLVDQLLERQITAIKIPLKDDALRVQLGQTPAEQPDTEALTKEITEALELLASPVVTPPVEELVAPEAVAQ